MFEPKKTSSGVNTYISYNFWGDSSGDGNNVPTTSTPISGLIFKAAAFKANRIRYHDLFRANLSNPNVSAGVFNNFGTDYEQAADLLDECFANAYELRTEASLTSSPFEDDYMFPFGGDNFIGNHVDTIKVFDKNNVQDVWYYYDLWQFDFILGIAAVVVCAKLLVYLVFGLMKRIFELVVLFLIAAPIASIMPIDDGEALKKWRQKFVSKVLSAYAPIVGLNLFFVILPIVTSIKYFNIALLDAIVNMFFTIVGLVMVKDLIQTLSELIGADNALKAGQDMAGEVGQTIAKVGQLATAPVGMAVKGAKFGFNAAKFGHKKVKQRRENNALDEHNLEQMSDEQRKTFNSLGGKDRRRILRGMRDSMSAEERSEAIKENAYMAAGAYTRHKMNKTSRAFDELGARQYYAARGEDYENLGRKERKQRRKEYHEMANSEDVKNYREARANISNLTERRRGIDQERDKEIATLNQTNLKYGSAAYNEKLRQINERYDPQYQRVDAEIAQNRNTQREIEQRQAASGNADAFNDLIKAVDSTRDSKLMSAHQSGGFLKSSFLNNPDDWRKAGQFMAGGFAKALADNLTPIFNTLAGDMAKGWKDAGGAGGIEARLKGLAGKEEKLNEAIKEQKRILAAQDKASQLLGRNRGPATQTVRLDDASINQLASTIQDRTKNR